MPETLVQFPWNKFASVSAPYLEDDFVRSNSIPLEIGAFKASDYYLHLKDGLLERLIKSISRQNPQKTINVVDAGVYMGAFSIAVSLICRENSIGCDIQAIEGMPRLMASAQMNFDLYEVENIRIQNNIVGYEDDKLLKIGARKGGLIGATAFQPDQKAGDDGEIHEVKSVSLVSIISDLKENHSIVKIDIEGNEVNAFRSLVNGDKNLNKIVYIVEFAPWQAKHSVSDCENYGEFLLSRFKVFNIVNWNNSNPHPESLRIESFDDLMNCIKSERSFNTDLLLIPFGLDVEL